MFAEPQVPALSTWSADPLAVPHCPILFLYGAKKGLMFHSPKWADSLNKRGDGSKSVAIQCGHWLQLDEPDQVNDHMKGFLNTQGHY
jgi:pimeloyl-ACP methyl ester carboxylesterase